MGRKTKLTPDVQRAIIRAIELGAPYHVAAGVAGITYSTFRNWMVRGENARRSDSIYLKFFEAVKKAESAMVLRQLAIIESAAADGSWQAAAWKLERRLPGDFGRQQHDVAVDGELVVKVVYAEQKKDS